MNRSRLSTTLLLALAAALAGGCASAPPEKSAPPAAPQVEQEKPKPEPLVLKPDYPSRYVVVPGDTLWDISARFLRDPWRWPELWQKNEYIRNPHLIYPGDVLTLAYIEGQPRIQVQRAQPGERGTVRLSPSVRVEELTQPIPTIPIDVIRPFLLRPRVVTQEELDAAPYMVSSADEHLIAAAGNRIYARGITDTNVADYVVVRQGQAYVNPDNDEVLGYEATHIADARIVRFGDPATLLLTASKKEALIGDRLLPGKDEPPSINFVPKSPDLPVTGRIIAVADGGVQISQFQVVVLNLGLSDGIAAGDVLAVYAQGESVKDPVAGGSVRLPDERAGVVMIFRPFQRLSYALVMKATRAIHVLDRVTNP